MDALSVVIPVYNSEASLPLLIQQLDAALPRISRRHEIILINDGSHDASGDVIRGLASAYSSVRGIELMRNYGQHNALMAGIRVARHDIIVTMDDDLQHPPSEIAHLLQRLLAGADVVYGVPAHEQHGFVRDLASRVTKIVLQRAMGAETARRISAFRAFRTNVRNAFQEYRGSYVNLDVLLTWATTRFSAVVVKHDERRFGVSNYTMGKLIVHSLNMVTGFSVLPLQLASLVGFASMGLGLLILVVVIGRYFLERSVPGFPFLASIISIFAGAQMFSIGIIGEYLSRVHFRLLDRPLYAVRTEVGPRDD